ncbi:MAG: hypothetical protein ACFFD4_21350 [Candidatus Odinarchaeota archaeon]
MSGTQPVSSKLQTSAEILDYLNRKSFATLTKGDNVYTSEEATQLPEIYPMLVLAVKRFVNSFRDEPINVEIDPGLGITLQQVSMDKITPSSFVSFGKKLSHGDFLIHSFSPTKEFNWYQASDLLEQIGEEMDAVLDDISVQNEWQEKEYDILVKLIAEKARLVNDALHSQGFATLQFGKPQKYREMMSFVSGLKINYDRAPLVASLAISDDKKGDERFLSIFNTVETVLQVAIEPINQLNEDSLHKGEKIALSRFIEDLVTKIGSNFVSLAEITEIIDSLTPVAGPLNPNLVKTYMKRYFGAITARIIVHQYLKLLGNEVKDWETIEEMEEFISRNLQRGYFLGIFSKFDYKDNLLSGIPEFLRTFAIEKKLESVKREAINNATIKIANELRENPEKLDIPAIGFQNSTSDFQQLVLQYFLQEFINKPISGQDDPKISIYSNRFQDFLITGLKSAEDLICSEPAYNRAKDEIVKAIEMAVPAFMQSLKKEFFDSSIRYLLEDLFFDEALPLKEEFTGFSFNSIFQFFEEFIERWSSSLEEERSDLLHKLLGESYDSKNFEFNIRKSEYQEFCELLKNTVEPQFQNLMEKARYEIPRMAIDWSNQYSDLQNFLEFWFKDFSGLLPDEITLRLNTGILYLNIDYVVELFFAAYIEKDEDGPIDFGRLKEKGRLMMEAYKEEFEIIKTTDTS